MKTDKLRVFRASSDDVALAREALSDARRSLLEGDAWLVAFLTDPACYLMLAVEEGRVAGSLIGYSLRRLERVQPQFLLYAIGVREAYRGRGIGTALVSAFSAEARAAGAYEQWVVTNESNLPAMAMYRRCGYGRPNPDDVMLNMQV